MRDTRRIKFILDALEHYWRRYPDLRLGQIVGNFANVARQDPYYYEDDELIAALSAALEAPDGV